MRVIVCGSRDWRNYALLVDVLRPLAGAPDITIVHGGAKGADRQADHWARDWQLRVQVYPADWPRHGRAAGAIRNQQMLDAGADLVVAFSTKRPATPGTGHMCRIAYDADVVVHFVSADGRRGDYARRIDRAAGIAR